MLMADSKNRQHDGPLLHTPHADSGDQTHPADDNIQQAEKERRSVAAVLGFGGQSEHQVRGFDDDAD